MATIITSQIINTGGVFGSFKDFIISNGILTTASGIMIGIATLLYIKALTIDFFIPLVYLVFFSWYGHFSTKIQKFVNKGFPNIQFHWSNIIKESISWLVILLVSFIFLEYIVRRSLLRYKLNEIPEEEKTLFRF